MLRVMMLAPLFLLCLSAVLRRQTPRAQSSGPVTFPWFALLFVAVALFNSLHLLPAGVVAMLNQLAGLLLAMAALGLTTRFSALREAGVTPLLLGALVFSWLIVGGGAINLLVQHFIG